MRPRNKIVFLTPEHLEEHADARAQEATQLPEGKARQNALRNAAQLRVYASMKRVLSPQMAKNRNNGNFVDGYDVERWQRDRKIGKYAQDKK
jgi:hypothetical protein